MGAIHQALLGIGAGSADARVLLAHFDGADTSTTFTDVMGHTLTANGNAQLDTAQKKWGTASLLLDGTGDYVTSPSSDDWRWGSLDWTIEFWVRFNVATGTQTFVSRYENTTNQRAFHFRLVSGNTLAFQWFQSGTGTGGATASGSWTPSTATWYFVGAKRSGNDVSVWVDGSQIGTVTNNDFIVNSNQPLTIGAVNSSGHTQFLNGWLDDMRLTKGLARDLSVVPSGAFPD